LHDMVAAARRLLGRERALLERLATSDGFFGDHKGAAFSVSAQVIAGDASAMELGYEGRTTRWNEDLPTPEGIGAEAGRRAVAAVGGRKIESTTAPVIFERRLATSLLGPLIGGISGSSVARGVSFLKEKLGQPVFARGITITDDPHRRRGLGSSPFDDEGVANQLRAIIDDGVLTTSTPARRASWGWRLLATRRAAWPDRPASRRPT
jgi:PmbA protein